MSSTGRGGLRAADDFYETPTWAVDALLRRVGPLHSKRLLEPSAGTGGIVRRLLAAGAQPSRIAAVELDPWRADAVRALAPGTGLAVMCIDFLKIGSFYDFSEPETRFDLVVMNPPFTMAQEHVEMAISLLAPGGLCAALLRLAFGASKKRAPFRARYPYDKLELASRPSFTNGGTDSADYAWFCFGRWPVSAPLRAGEMCGGHFMVLEDASR